MSSPGHPDPAVIRWLTYDKLLQDAEKKNYHRIEALYTAANLKNDDLVPLLDEKRALDVRLPETIFNDMCYVLAERIAESGTRFISQAFRMRSPDGKYEWKIVTLLSLPAGVQRKYLFELQEAGRSVLNALKLEYGDSLEQEDTE